MRSKKAACRKVPVLGMAVVLLSWCVSGAAQALAGPTFASPTFAAGTAIPVLFTRSIEAGKTQPGAAVAAETMQEVALADGRIAPKGTKLLGHVLASTRLRRRSGPRAPTDDSILSFQFDSANVLGSTVPLTVVLRVLASRVVATDALTPRYLDVKDKIGTFTLIGGDLYLRTDTDVVTPGSRIVGYKDRQGVFGKLEQGGGENLRCDASKLPQSLAIFSPEACGLYGFEKVSAAQVGGLGGAFVLRSERENVSVYAYSAAFLEVVAPSR